MLMRLDDCIPRFALLLPSLCASFIAVCPSSPYIMFLQERCAAMLLLFQSLNKSRDVYSPVRSRKMYIHDRRPLQA